MISRLSRIHSKPKVTNFCSSFWKQNVRWLKISMNEISTMDESQSRNYSLDDGPGTSFTHFALADEVEQVPIRAILHSKNQIVPELEELWVRRPTCINLMTLGWSRDSNISASFLRQAAAGLSSSFITIWTLVTHLDRNLVAGLAPNHSEH